MKAAIPRQARHALDLREALREWRKIRLLSVAKSCENLKDNYRTEFGQYHKTHATHAAQIINEDHSDEQVLKLANNWLKQFKNRFKQKGFSGARRDATGICGAELEQILLSFEANNE